MKILLLLLPTILFCGSLYGQIEKFDGFGYTVDSTFTEIDNMEMLYITYRDSESNLVGRIGIGFRDDLSILNVASRSEKGLIYYKFNEEMDVVYEKVNHLEREFSHKYMAYEYNDNGLVERLIHYDSLRNLTGVQKFIYIAGSENCEKVYDYDANGHLKTSETYAYLESGELAMTNQYNGDHLLIGQHVTAAKAWNGYEQFYVYSYNVDNTLIGFKYAELDKDGQPIVNNEYTFQYIDGEVYSFRENTEEAIIFEGNERFGAVKTYRFVNSHNETTQEELR